METWRAAYAGLVPDSYLVGMTETGQAISWRRIIGGGGANLVAEARDAEGGLTDRAQRRRLVGFGSCGPRRVADLPYAGEIYALYVAVDWQGRGLGRRLLGGLFGALLRAEVPDAYLWVLARNPSRFFYEAMGGQRVAERKERFAGTQLEEIAYAWPDLESWLAAWGED